MLTDKAHRMELILRCWEDFWLLTSAYIKLRLEPSLSVGLPSHWSEFREYLKTLRQDQPAPFDGGRFWVREKTIKTNTFLTEIQLLIAEWVRQSRRVFTLSSDLQMLLDATSLEGVTFDQVKLPFETFAVALANPLMDKYGNRFDYVIISNQLMNPTDESKTLIICTVDESFSRYTPFSEDEKRLIKKTLRDANLPRMFGLYTKFCARFEKIRRYSIDASFRYDSEKHTPVTEMAHNAYFGRMERPEGWMDSDQNSALQKDRIATVNVADAAIRTAVGLCLYLKTLPNQSPHQSAWQKPEQIASVTRPITADAEVCEVSSQFTLSPQEREVFGDPNGQPTRSFGEKCCHFRRGSWRRPMGLGHDPTAAKTEWFRPTIVRKDKLKPGELPRGAENIILGCVKT